MSFSPLAIIVVAMGTLNYVVIKQMVKDEDHSDGDGPLLYHKTEIFCNILLAMMMVSIDVKSASSPNGCTLCLQV